MVKLQDQHMSAPVCPAFFLKWKVCVILNSMRYRSTLLMGAITREAEWLGMTRAIMDLALELQLFQQWLVPYLQPTEDKKR